MKRILLILTLIFLTISCNQNAQNIPDTIINNEKNNFDISGTRISINKPDDFIFYPELSRIQKDDNNKIQILEIKDADFIAYKNKFLIGIESGIKNGGKVDYQKQIKINGYDGLVLGAPQSRNNSYQTVLLFGDKTFTVMMAGITPLGNEEAKKQILKTILTTKYDKTKLINDEELNKFTIDLKNSNFKFSKNMGGVSFYTINGEGTFGDKLTDILMVQILPAKMTKEDMENYSQRIIDKMENNTYPEKNIKINNLEKKFYSENGNEILEYNLNNSYQNQNYNSLLILKSTDNATILFSVIDKTKQKTELLKEVFKTIKLK